MSIKLVESVQRRATKCVRNLKDLSYRERLQQLKLPTLAYRRSRGAMIEVWKMFNIYDSEVIPTLLKPPQDKTRGHNLKLYSSKCKKLHPKQHSFSQRVVKPWNSLPERVVNSKSLNIFKNRLDKHWEAKKYITDDSLANELVAETLPQI